MSAMLETLANTEFPFSGLSCALASMAYCFSLYTLLVHDCKTTESEMWKALRHLRSLQFCLILHIKNRYPNTSGNRPFEATGAAVCGFHGKVE